MRPGHDYALSETVHCKSPEEIGVTQALETCADAYLEPVLRASAAKVIVVTGAQAAKTIRLRYDLDEDTAMQGPLVMGDRERMLAFIPHPTSFAPRKTFRGCLATEQLLQLKQWLAD